MTDDDATWRLSAPALNAASSRLIAVSANRGNLRSGCLIDSFKKKTTRLFFSGGSLDEVQRVIARFRAGARSASAGIYAAARFARCRKRTSHSSDC